MGGDFICRRVDTIAEALVRRDIPDIDRITGFLVSCEIPEFVVVGYRPFGSEAEALVPAVQVGNAGEAFVDGGKNGRRAPGGRAQILVFRNPGVPVIEKKDVTTVPYHIVVQSEQDVPSISLVPVVECRFGKFSRRERGNRSIDICRCGMAFELTEPGLIRRIDGEPFRKGSRGILPEHILFNDGTGLFQGCDAPVDIVRVRERKPDVFLVISGRTVQRQLMSEEFPVPKVFDRAVADGLSPFFPFPGLGFAPQFLIHPGKLVHRLENT